MALSKKQLRELEETVVDAWPVPEAEALDGWWLRRSGGPSRRGNSVSTLDAGRSLELDARIAAVEAWYGMRGQPAIFQIGPAVNPPDLDAALERRGYRVEGAALFARAEPADVLRHPALALATQVDAKPSAAFREVILGASRFASSYDTLLGVLAALGTRCRFATAFDAHGTPAAACVGIASEDRLGIYAMITRPEARRSGAATALIRALAERATRDGVRELYLLVDRDNDAARPLYAARGFGDVYGYHYRVQPSQDGNAAPLAPHT